MSHDSDYARVVPPRSPSAPTATAEEEASIPPLDYRGTRKAPRIAMKKDAQASIDGNRAVLVDLSTVGAQVVAETVLRPNRQVRLTLSDAEHTVRVAGTIAWASFEMSQAAAGPQYRAGIEFVDPDTDAIEAFSLVNRAAPAG